MHAIPSQHGAVAQLGAGRCAVLVQQYGNLVIRLLDRYGFRSTTLRDQPGKIFGNPRADLLPLVQANTKV